MGNELKTRAEEVLLGLDLANRLSCDVPITWEAQKSLQTAYAALRAIEAALTAQADTRIQSEPTEAMLQAACDATFGPKPMSPEAMHRIGWRAMYAAALATKPTVEELTAALAPPADLSDQIAIGPNGLPTDPVLRAMAIRTVLATKDTATVEDNG